MTPLDRTETLRLGLTCTRCGHKTMALFDCVSLAREESGVCRPCAVVLELPVIRRAFNAGIITKDQATALVAAL